ncbi:chromosome partition protein Smc [Gottschalkia purinilytica]|uniref:Chromosome partition protein Smc n=1 Tax=Gottschalkia purinilytica TaxID=1503 RepID=A0A0L0WBQ8_GOTPU|nr:chromosome segregation protein SMC [Gottschalkia purinilytica]KNF08780.1 chromosome partition protein Smc [Gottschalkia purinilytica]
MFLKRLEIQGFKSFAQKIEIDFEGGVTGVVGPNGSGKSNISDSVRWVLGEQSVKNLRGSKMEDVIFSGTSKRKPLGYAEVTLVLDNKDKKLPVEYSEVCVTRRVFRSGESEYYINKNSCRLKDIKELFMDTGVGKDGYSIIGQGRIDEILSSKSEDRRNIFEEAAGIVKYKTRKEEAEKKLEKTKENLLRIDDIVSELENQLGPLKQQSEKAEKFKELSEALKKLEVSLFIREIDRLKEELGHIEAQRKLIEDQLSHNEEKRSKLEIKYNQGQEEIKKMDFNIEKIQTLKYDTQSKSEKQDGEIKLFKEKIIYLKKEVERYEEEIISLGKTINDILSQKEIVSENKKEIDSSVNNLNLKLNDKNKELEEILKNIRDKEKYIDEKKSDIIQILNLMSDKKSRINSMLSFKQSIEKRMNQIKKELEDMDIQQKHIDKEIEETNKEINETRNKIQNFITSKNNTINEKNKKIQELQNLQVQINGIRENIQGKSSNYRLLNEMKNEYEGYYKSVKNFLIACKRNNDLGKGVRGVVAELISVDKKYEKAIEVALGSFLQNIVTETQEDAKNAINYLKKYNLGRITFLPMSSISSRGLSANDKNLCEENGAIGIASQLIKFDNDYKNIFEYLLGRVLIVNNIDDGIKISKRSNHSIKIVSLDGDVLNPGGSMTGGSYKTGSTNILGRERQIKELEEQIEKLKNEYTLMSDKLRMNESEIASIDNSLLKIDNSINELNLNLARIENKQSQNYDNKNKNEILIEKYLSEDKQLSEENNNVINDVKKLEEDLENLKKDNDITQNSIDEYTKHFEDEKKKRDTISKDITDIKIKAASFEQELKNITESLQRLELEKQKSENSIQVKTLEKENSIKEINEMNVKLEELIRDRNNLNDTLRDYDLKLNDIKNDKNNFVQSFYNEQENLKEMNATINELQKSMNTLELKYEKYNVQLENYNNKMWEEYEMSYQMALSHREEVENVTKVQNEVRTLKNKVKSLGNINLDAIEEYKRVNERHEFMVTQRDDLIEAKESLNIVIKDMDVKMKEQFTENFKVIRKHFVEVFEKLFGGGKADIYLQDEENVLTSGIEIIAQPPGKKLQSLSLLSGGERALTAIALLFAILKTKPTPFCILDEIEAALDDANVYRYAEYLKEFSKETQFIVITHRKGTMESVDSLYGVTMEEHGISKLVSVKLSEKLGEEAS